MCIITDIHGSVTNILLWLTNCARSLGHLQCLTTHTKTTKSKRLQPDTRWLHVGSLIICLNEEIKTNKKTKQGCFHIVKQYDGLMFCIYTIVLEMDSYIHKNNQSREKVGKIIYCCLMHFLHPAVCVF